jgi:hypothetical protein
MDIYDTQKTLTLGDELVFMEGDREIGRYFGGVFRKFVLYPLHYYRIGKSYPIASWVIDALKRTDCEYLIVTAKNIQVDDEVPSIVYRIPFDKFLAISIPFRHANYEKQEYVPISKWEILNEEG